METAHSKLLIDLICFVVSMQIMLQYSVVNCLSCSLREECLSMNIPSCGKIHFIRKQNDQEKVIHDN